MNADEGPAPEVAWLYQDTPASLPAPRSSLTPARFPASIVVTQGLLLVVMLAVGFGLGRVSQRGSTPSESFANRPATLVGRIQYGTSGGTTFADEGAIVLVVPTDQRPAADERLAYEGLRPTDLPLDAQHATLERLRILGGGVARADASGNYRVSLPRSGNYFVLILSHHGARRAQVAPNKSDLAQLGRYVNMANELLGDRRYRWRVEAISGTRRLDETLPF